MKTQVLRRSCRGVSIIEMALLLPLLLLVLMGMLEYGWMFWKNQEINNAARHGVRVAIREGATNTEVNDAVDLIMTARGLASSGYTVTITPGDVFLAEPGDVITVHVEVPYANITLTGAPFLPAPTNIGGETSMSKEGPR